MFEEHINKRVKIVYEDEGEVNTVKGKCIGFEKAGEIVFVKIELDDGKIQSIKIEKVNRIVEQEEKL